MNLLNDFPFLYFELQSILNFRIHFLQFFSKYFEIYCFEESVTIFDDLQNYYYSKALKNQ